MAVDVEAICTGLARVVSAVVPCEPVEPSQFDGPAAWVVLGADGEDWMPEPHEAMSDGLCALALTVRVGVSAAGGFGEAVRALWPFMGSGTGQSRSVVDAIYEDSTFRGALAGGGVRVFNVSAPRAEETLGGVTVVVFDVPMRVYQART
jgi:hypothetical protein